MECSCAIRIARQCAQRLGLARDERNDAGDVSRWMVNEKKKLVRANSFHMDKCHRFCHSMRIDACNYYNCGCARPLQHIITN